MGKIGFKMSHEVDVQDKQDSRLLTAADINVDDLIQRKGLIKAVEVIREYLSDQYPFMEAQSRDKKYITKLRKIRERYFEPI